jgi:prolyl oligopeptidase PreP (S9A serine peptidase family)
MKKNIKNDNSMRIETIPFNQVFNFESEHVAKKIINTILSAAFLEINKETFKIPSLKYCLTYMNKLFDTFIDSDNLLVQQDETESDEYKRLTSHFNSECDLEALSDEIEEPVIIYLL